MNSVYIGLNGFARGQVFDFDVNQAQVIHEVDKEHGRRRIIGCLDRDTRWRMPDWSTTIIPTITATFTTDNDYILNR